MSDEPTGGLAHTMDLRLPIPRQPRKRVTILHRWDSHWSPRCVLASKHTHDPAYSFSVYRESYDRRVAALLRAGIPWTTILRSDLDSPLQNGLEFDRALCLAIERRNSRMRRVKGQGKKYASKRNSRQ